MTNYFSHDSNARNDEKIIALRILHGWEGYGLYWAIIEKLRDATNYQLSTDYSIIAYDLRTDVPTIESIVSDFNLFEVEANYFYAPSLCKRMCIKDSKSEKARHSAKSRWENSKKTTTNKALATRNKAKQNKFVPPTEQEVENYCRERQNSISPQKFVNFYQSKGWMVGNSKMKDWKAAMRIWERNQNNEKRAMSNKTQPHDYTLPYNNEAEQAVLGALILESGSYYEVNQTLSYPMFYAEAHQVIYRAIDDMNKRASPVDMLTLSEVLRKENKLDLVGGPYYIATLTGMVASASHITQHALYIKQEYLKREVLKVAQESIRSIVSGVDVSDVLTSSLVSLNILEEGATNTDTLKHIKDFASQSIDEVEQRVINYRNGTTNGIRTGFENLDKVTGGWQKGDLVIIAARPAMGKTALALSILEASAQSGNDVAMFALEMKGERLTDRLILEKTGIQDWKYKQGSLTNEELSLVADTSAQLFRLPVYIDDNSSQTISRIKSKCRLLMKQDKCKLIIIDYLQLTEGEGDSMNREQEVARISREAKKMAKSLNVPVIMLSQLNRSLESRADKRPLLSDIRESGAIEQDADMVIFVHRPEYYNQKLLFKDTEIPNGIELIIAKYREGATGSVFLQHDGSVRNIRDWRE